MTVRVFGEVFYCLYLKLKFTISIQNGFAAHEKVVRRRFIVEESLEDSI
jgi:hypothetical protein